MGLTVLNVAYPLAPVSADSVGGAEQIISLLDRALVEKGHRSFVVACEGSVCAGALVGIPPTAGQLSHHSQPTAQSRTREAIISLLKRERVDVVHLHGLDFPAYLPPPGPPALVTLHLPPAWYEPTIFRLSRPQTYLHCVSASQRRACPPGVALLPEIENGVPVDDLAARHGKRRYVISLGRICREKGFHLALDAARFARIPMVLAGRVYPYVEHERYFDEEIAPRLDRHRRFVGAATFARKRRLLTGARALLVPSLAPETSSLVAMEAMACGTPVVAFRSGALCDLVEHGVTGFLVGSAVEMAEAIHAAASLDPEACRATARTRFSKARMVAQYLARYEQLARGAAQQLQHGYAA